MDTHDSTRSTLPLQMPLAGQARWHRVVGIICIVVSILSPLGQQMKNAGMDGDAYQAVMTQWSGKLMMMGVGATVIALILAGGGILLLLKKRQSAVVLKTWAGLQIAFLFVTIPINAGFQKAMAELHFAGALAGEGAESAASAGRIGIVVAIAAGVLLGLLLPTFILGWFSRKKIREQVAFWD